MAVTTSSTVPLMMDIEGGHPEEDYRDTEKEGGGIKNDFAYHNNVAGAAKHIRICLLYTSPSPRD